MSSLFKALNHYNQTGEVIACDESLAEHDARFHGGHYDGKGKCEYREGRAKGDKADKLAEVEGGKGNLPASKDVDHRLKADAQKLYGRIREVVKAIESTFREVPTGYDGYEDGFSDDAAYSLLDVLEEARPIPGEFANTVPDGSRLDPKSADGILVAAIPKLDGTLRKLLDEIADNISTTDYYYYSMSRDAVDQLSKACSNAERVLEELDIEMEDAEEGRPKEGT